jgi:hypothetical protein
VQQRHTEASVYLAAQAADLHVDHIGLRIEIEIPYMLEQHGARHQPARIAHQVFQQTELAGLQADEPAGAFDRLVLPVDDQVGYLQALLLCRRLVAPGQCLQPCQQFAESVGLDQVVVAPRPQTLDTIIHLAERRQHERRRLVPVSPQHADDCQSVAPGQHAVDDDDVIVTVQGKIQADIAVGRMVDDVTTLAEPFCQVFSGQNIIFNQQDMHAGQA